MAILRGGKRIGGFDVRIGIPRDRSLDNVQGDSRLKQRAGGNPDSTMGRIQAFVNEAEGFARKARFYVEFQLPNGVGENLFGTSDNDTVFANEVTDETRGFALSKDLRATQLANARRVQIFCSAIDMPSREIITKEIRHNGPGRKIAYDAQFADITATFYTDKFLRERSFFELWQKAAYSNSTFNFNYYNDYVSPMNILQLGNYASQNERDDVTYAVKLFDCFPKTVGAVSYTHESNTVQTFDVTFTFRYWVNYFIDEADNVSLLGQKEFNIPTVKYGGLFGGLFSKLPPELRRAGRDVLNDIRRRVPIGPITGGRVFPPFRIPPLNI
tara:strand:+ start:622 stop:1605 length:984 start_codon:yes stop_codon:yes gene_type:complete